MVAKVRSFDAKEAAAATLAVNLLCQKTGATSSGVFVGVKNAERALAQGDHSVVKEMLVNISTHNANHAAVIYRILEEIIPKPKETQS